MKLMANWDAKDDHVLIDLLRQPGLNENDLLLTMLAQLTHRDGGMNVSVYDARNTNILEWALTNEYFRTFKEMLEILVEHAKENKNDIGLVTGMIHEAMNLAHTCDMIDQEFLMVAAQKNLNTAHETPIARQFPPGYD